MAVGSVFRGLQFWIALAIIVLAAYVGISTFLNAEIVETHVRVGPFFIHHWFSLTGTAFIAFFTPFYYVLKRRSPHLLRGLLRVHVFGNLISVLLISNHFGHQLGRPAEFYPDLATGIVLYPVALLLVLTGFLMRFNFGVKNRRNWRFIHSSLTVTFYAIILVHVLHGFGII